MFNIPRAYLSCIFHAIMQTTRIVNSGCGVFYKFNSFCMCLCLRIFCIVAPSIGSSLGLGNRFFFHSREHEATRREIIMESQDSLFVCREKENVNVIQLQAWRKDYPTFIIHQALQNHPYLHPLDVCVVLNDINLPYSTCIFNMDIS